MNGTQELSWLLQDRIVIMDGAMGTMIQQYNLEEPDYRGERFQDWVLELKGNNDLLNLTRPDIIEDIHVQYLEAGADIIETNSFNAQAISLEDYKMADLAYEINVSSARLARNAVETFRKKHPNEKKFVAGVLGPMNKTLSLSPDVNRPEFRAVQFDQVASAYEEQVSGLIEGGVDILLIETIFDTLNAKGAIRAIKQVFRKVGYNLPVMISGTITDASGRTLSGQTVEAFYVSVQHADPVSIGLNCALGPGQMRPYIRELAEKIPFAISCHPNAGLPNALGQYEETPEQMAEQLRDFAREGWLNIVGGCCGSTPAHIRAIKEAVHPLAPRPLVRLSPVVQPT